MKKKKLSPRAGASFDMSCIVFPFLSYMPLPREGNLLQTYPLEVVQEKKKGDETSMPMGAAVRFNRAHATLICPFLLVT